LIVAAALSQAGLFSRCLSSRPLQVIGMMSCSLYVWHVPILQWLRPSRLGIIAFSEGSLLYLSVVFIIATVSYRFIEFPRVKDWRPLFLFPHREEKLQFPPVTTADQQTALGGLPPERRELPPSPSLRSTRVFLFIFRMLAGWLFLHASLSQVLNPNFVATHVVPVLSHEGLFHPFFSIFATPTLAPVVGFLVAYGHLLIGLSLLVGLMVPVSASLAVVLLMLYWLASIELPDLTVVGHSSIAGAILLVYRIVRYVGELIGDIHVLYSVILVYLIAGHAGHVWGLDAWAEKIPFLARLRVRSLAPAPRR
jgi:thiosulfate dehydrogenase (quinone) large subunit